MDWRTRIAAIVLAGGSVAGCASAADPGDAGSPEAGAASTPPVIDPAPAALVLQSVEVTPQPSRRPPVPVCNANPDPCCRFPDAPGCGVVEEPPEAGPADVGCSE